MGDAIEFHGRIARSDGKLVAAGRFDLSFRLYSDASGPTVLWSEDLDEVQVGVGGSFTVILGLQEPLSARLFAVTPRFMSVCVRKDDTIVEAGERLPMTGLLLRLSEDVADLRDAFDETRGTPAAAAVHLPGGENIDPEARKRLVKLHRRLRRM